MIESNPVQLSELVIQIMRLDRCIKDKSKKITMYNFKPTKIIGDKLEKKIKKLIKKYKKI